MSSRTFTTPRSLSSIHSAKLAMLETELWTRSPLSVIRGGSPSVRKGLSTQRLGWPVRHSWHSPQKAEPQAITWSPGCTYVTFEPTASTTPAASWPRIAGVRIGIRSSR